MRKIRLDFRGAKTGDEVQDYLKKMFGFPEYYGKNLDALYDMLTESREDIRVEIADTEMENEEENMQRKEYLERVLRVFREAEEENRHLRIYFSKSRGNSGKRKGDRV